jgi:hypothetical protein
MCNRGCCNWWNKAISKWFLCNRTSSRSKGSNTSVPGVWVEEVVAQVEVEPGVQADGVVVEEAEVGAQAEAEEAEVQEEEEEVVPEVP